MCHLEVSGDRAATMASHLVSFLRGNPTTAGCVDIFVMGAFDIHLRKYASVSPNPRNILRDNNLATMLVVCYLQQSCRSYLVSILQPVMTAIAPFVHNCELDPNRLANDHDTATTSRNAYNLYCVCRSVLDAVFSAGKHAPVEMRRLCALIRTRIEAAWEPLSAYSPTPNAPSRQDTPVSKQKEPEQPILELKDWETDLKTTVQVDIMSDIKAALEGWLEHPDKERAIASATLPSSAMSSTLKHVSNSQRREPHVRLTKHASNIGVTENNKYADNKVHSPGDANSYSEARQSLVKMMSSSFSSSDRLDTSLSTSKQKRLQIPEPLRASEIKNTWRQTQSPRKTMGPGMSARFSKHASRRYSGSYFTPVETVISMLIFVR
ncbi:hypothetical protein BX070DRAFT_92210 [Coemansia spiralis]|nr:hypothetical protein BX070DRAFT_92210 [Coemansia spiralis]